MGRPFTREERRERSRQLGILVDPQDDWLLSEYTWIRHASLYIVHQAYIGGRIYTLFLHHFIMGMPIHEGIVIDHINRNPDDNRRSNLRAEDNP